MKPVYICGPLCLSPCQSAAKSVSVVPLWLGGSICDFPSTLQVDDLSRVRSCRATIFRFWTRFPSRKDLICRGLRQNRGIFVQSGMPRAEFRMNHQDTKTPSRRVIRRFRRYSQIVFLPGSVLSENQRKSAFICGRAGLSPRLGVSAVKAVADCGGLWQIVADRGG